MIDNIREILKKMKWKPDYSNPDDIRQIVIKGPGNRWRFWVGIVLLILAQCEMGGAFIGFPGVVNYCDYKICEGEYILFYEYLPLFLMLNTILMVVMASYAGFKIMKDD